MYILCKQRVFLKFFAVVGSYGIVKASDRFWSNFLHALLLAESVELLRIVLFQHDSLNSSEHLE